MKDCSCNVPKSLDCSYTSNGSWVAYSAVCTVPQTDDGRVDLRAQLLFPMRLMSDPTKPNFVDLHIYPSSCSLLSNSSFVVSFERER